MTFSGFNFKLIFQLQRLEQEHKMQLHQLENVNRDKKTENGNVNTSNSKLTTDSSEERIALNVLANVHQSSQTESIAANGKYCYSSCFLS